MIYTLAIGLGKGGRASVLGGLRLHPRHPAAHRDLSIAGLAALLHASALAFQVVKYLGVAYLLYTAWVVLREGGAMDGARRRPGQCRRTGSSRAAFLLNILNPKLSLFFLAFLPQFVPESAARPDRRHC